jgi:hypothetical protein
MLEENDNGNYYELTKTISSFIDQNFIGKEALERMLNDYKDYYNQSGDERNKGRHLACEDLIKIIKTS